MAGDVRDGDANFLRRWSRRKLAATRPATGEPPQAASVPAPAAPIAQAPAGVTVGVAAGVAASAVAATVPAPDPAVAAGDEAPPLPPVDSLGIDSDFTRFLAPKVDETVKRQALRKLFADPHFNVMDGLDVYIDDYSKFEPIPDDLIGKLKHARYIFDPPKTRVNEAGHVEDVPDEPPPGSDAAKHADASPAPSEDTAPTPSANALPAQDGDAVLPAVAPDDTAHERAPAAPDDRADPR
jgi:hypothetical protein